MRPRQTRAATPHSIAFIKKAERQFDEPFELLPDQNLYMITKLWLGIGSKLKRANNLSGGLSLRPGKRTIALFSTLDLD